MSVLCLRHHYTMDAVQLDAHFFCVYLPNVRFGINFSRAIKICWRNASKSAIITFKCANTLFNIWLSLWISDHLARLFSFDIGCGRCCMVRCRRFLAYVSNRLLEIVVITFHVCLHDRPIQRHQIRLYTRKTYNKCIFIVHCQALTCAHNVMVVCMDVCVCMCAQCAAPYCLIKSSLTRRKHTKLITIIEWKHLTHLRCTHTHAHHFIIRI